MSRCRRPRSPPLSANHRDPRAACSPQVVQEWHWTHGVPMAPTHQRRVSSDSLVDRPLCHSPLPRPWPTYWLPLMMNAMTAPPRYQIGVARCHGQLQPHADAIHILMHPPAHQPHQCGHDQASHPTLLTPVVRARCLQGPPPHLAVRLQWGRVWRLEALIMGTSVRLQPTPCRHRRARELLRHRRLQVEPRCP